MLEKKSNSKYTINSECGVAHIEADSPEAAKEQYAREYHYDFDGHADYEGSWYFLSDEDGLWIEGPTEACP